MLDTQEPGQIHFFPGTENFQAKLKKKLGCTEVQSDMLDMDTGLGNILKGSHSVLWESNML